MSQKIPFVYRRVVKFGETDAAAMVYTPRFSDYCMEAAEVWFREYLGFDWYHINTSLGMGTPVVHMEIDFKAPLKGADILDVELRVERVGEKSVTLLFLGRKVISDNRNELSFTGRYVYCFTSQELGGRAITIPADQLSRIASYIEQLD